MVGDMVIVCLQTINNKSFSIFYEKCVKKYDTLNYNLSKILITIIK